MMTVQWFDKEVLDLLQEQSDTLEQFDVQAGCHGE
jgi:hypothetical protein